MASPTAPFRYPAFDPAGQFYSKSYIDRKFASLLRESKDYTDEILGQVGGSDAPETGDARFNDGKFELYFEDAVWRRLTPAITEDGVAIAQWIPLSEVVGSDGEARFNDGKLELYFEDAKWRRLTPALVEGVAVAQWIPVE